MAGRQSSQAPGCPVGYTEHVPCSRSCSVPVWWVDEVHSCLALYRHTTWKQASWTWRSGRYFCFRASRQFPSPRSLASMCHWSVCHLRLGQTVPHPGSEEVFISKFASWSRWVLLGDLPWMYGAALPSREPACPESHPLLKHTVALPFVLKNHGMSTDLYP